MICMGRVHDIQRRWYLLKCFRLGEVLCVIRVRKTGCPMAARETAPRNPRLMVSCSQWGSLQGH